LITYSTEEEAFTDQVQQLVTAVGEASASGGPVAIYLTAFAEVTDLFAAATGTTELELVQWYGSDSVALSADLVEDETAAAFAVKADYPNPILGLRNEDEPLWGPVSEELTAKLGRTPDAFALAAYDALIVAVEALEAAGEDADAAALGEALGEAANGHTGLTGPTELNDAGDRSLGNYDFWAVCDGDEGYEWLRVATYTAGVEGEPGEAKRETEC
jgi:ABC-type branched-subunit amino acid transport system substrate-binding protein